MGMVHDYETSVLFFLLYDNNELFLDDGTTSIAANSASAAVAEAGEDPGDYEDDCEDDEDVLKRASACKVEKDKKDWLKC
jgi:hypothetical protein